MDENLSMEANASGPANADSPAILVDQSTDVDLSMVANSDASGRSIGSEDPIINHLSTQARIPDFALFHTHAVKDAIVRELILLVEVKPYKDQTPESDYELAKHFAGLSLQVVTQALFALDESSDITEVKVLCIVGWHWRMIGPFRTGKRNTNVPHVGYRKPKDKGVIMLPNMPKGKFHDVVLGNPASAIQDGYNTDYLGALKSAWVQARETLSSGFRNIFDLDINGAIVDYNAEFKTEWAIMINDAKIVRK